MSDDRLFDPADYGVTERQRRPRRRKAVIAGYADNGWQLLAHLEDSPLIHVIECRSPFYETTFLARCGRWGIEITDHHGPAVLCPRCVAKAPAEHLPTLYHHKEAINE